MQFILGLICGILLTITFFIIVAVEFDKNKKQ